MGTARSTSARSGAGRILRAFLKGGAIAVCVVASLAVLYFGARGCNLYREALAATSLDQMAEAIEQQQGYTRLDELPGTYLDAVVAAEDHRFYRHPGVDAIATARALVNDLRAGAVVEGGSTITQQLAKNRYFTQDQTIERKVAEMLMAFAMERHFTKDKILELYVNSIYFGDGYSSIREASLGYFGTEPSAMTDAECTLLAGVPNAPSAYAPTASPELAAARQQQVLAQMVEYGALSRTEAHRIATATRSLLEGFAPAA